MPDTDVANTHELARARFVEVLNALATTGWTQVRVDTWMHRSGRAGDRDRWTVRHHHVAGEWTLYLERDRQYSLKSSATRSVKISRYKPLPTVRQALSELFGPHLADFVEPTAWQAFDELPFGALQRGGETGGHG